jgi:hypothetical protein
MKVTLDTNVLLDYLEHRPDFYQDAFDILEAHRAGQCYVVVTTRALADLRHPDEPDPASEMQHELGSLLSEYKIDEIGTLGRYGESYYSGGDYYSDGFLEKNEQRLLGLIWPGARPDEKRHRSRIRDIDHLVGHHRHGSNVFVTRDGQILRAQEVLRREFGIEVVSPRDLVERLKESPPTFDHA